VQAIAGFFFDKKAVSESWFSIAMFCMVSPDSLSWSGTTTAGLPEKM